MKISFLFSFFTTTMSNERNFFDAFYFVDFEFSTALDTSPSLYFTWIHCCLQLYTYFRPLLVRNHINWIKCLIFHKLISNFPRCACVSKWCNFLSRQFFAHSFNHEGFQLHCNVYFPVCLHLWSFNTALNLNSFFLLKSIKLLWLRNNFLFKYPSKILNICSITIFHIFLPTKEHMITTIDCDVRCGLGCQTQ